uniref:Lipopolysaccharide heptosyltransferase 1 n=1 Tax=Candidatus Kentrum sp. DK TaxID=2126562 RepID=A0A450SC14_9GAMM|nr:MAG: heptosyltransferase-1 [Candidatus Kentron sp. DK]
MKVLIVKTSSLGDVIHTLPALTDAVGAVPGIRFDWVVEEAYAEIPVWHPAVDNAIPVALRRWRTRPLDASCWRMWSAFKARVHHAGYDAVIDAQGLLKSAWITRYARGMTFGFDRRSAREPLAAWFYDAPRFVPRGQHAVERVRQLFAGALGYEDRAAVLARYSQGDYGLVLPEAPDGILPRAGSDPGARRPGKVVFLHGTTWPTKHWPERAWIALSRQFAQAGLQVILPWGSEPERLRAERIADASGGEVPDRMNLTALVRLMAGAAGCVSVDTGLGHLAAAVNTPTVSLFGPTNPELTGFYGKNQRILCSGFPCAPCLRKNCSHSGGRVGEAPCFGDLSADSVFDTFMALMEDVGR